MTKIYLAGSCSIENRTMMVKIADLLRDFKYEVLAPFEYKVENEWKISQEEWAQEVFNHDCELIKQADIILIITPGRISSAGTNWEQGYAYGLGKRVYVAQIGREQTSIMTYCGCNGFKNFSDHYLSDIPRFISKELIYEVNEKECDGVLT